MTEPVAPAATPAQVALPGATALPAPSPVQIPQLPGVPSAPADVPEPGMLEQILQMALVAGASALAKDPSMLAEGILGVRQNVQNIRQQNVANRLTSRSQDIAARGQEGGLFREALESTMQQQTKASEAAEKSRKDMEDLRHRVQKAELAAAEASARSAGQLAEARGQEAGAKTENARLRLEAQEREAKDREAKARKAINAGASKSFAGAFNKLRAVPGANAGVLDTVQKRADEVRAQLVKQSGEDEPTVKVGSQTIVGADNIRAMFEGLRDDAAFSSPEAAAGLNDLIRAVEDLLSGFTPAAE